jgi:2,4-dienoyl-CoA reductase-like NADH-dependent reductase (Old Yellow Enzyme family)
MPKLFEPIKLRELTVKNRIWIAPMCQYSCENKDGVPGSWHEVHLASRAIGGAGLILVEASAVCPEGRITPWCTGIWNDEQAKAWKKIVDLSHNHGAKMAMQLDRYQFLKEAGKRSLQHLRLSVITQLLES